MIILAIETSCDDTCIAVIEAGSRGIKILSNVVSSQVKLHAKYGGVYPFLAKREHQKNLPAVLKKALKKAGLSIPKIDLFAVTVGPGLEPCLWQGVNFAKELAKKLNLPLIPVNHIEAHILANFINLKSKILAPYRTEGSGVGLNLKSIFPAVCLVVSGGHTQLILMEGIGKYQILGETRDDAAGECFDKAARILGLGYPGGPVIATEAEKFKVKSSRFKVRLPRPMIGHKNYDFSFSGLKTAVLYDFKSRIPKIRKSKEYIQAMCVEIQQAIIDVLIKKTIKASKDFGAKTIILGGGVSANEELRRQLKEKIKKEIPDTKYLVPDPRYCTDNALMIALTAYFNHEKKVWKKIEVNANLVLRQ